MAVTENSYTGNGSTTNYSFTFPYLKSTDVQVQVDAAVTTAWSFANATTVQFNTAPASGAKIKILRDTNVDSLAATFYAGSSIKSEDLNDNYTQNLYKTQEVGARYFSNTGGTMTGDLTLDTGVDLIFEGATADAHETKLGVTDPTADQTYNLPNHSAGTYAVITTGDTGTVATGMIAADAINGTKIADDSINSEHYADGSIDTQHIADSQITAAKIADNGVTLSKMADNSVGTGELIANAVTTVKIIDDAVTNAKLADNAVVTENIADGQVDAVKLNQTSGAEAVVTNAIRANAVTNAKLADNAVTLAKMADNSVGTGELIANAVTTVKIIDNAVTTAKITDAAVETDKLANNAVTTAKILNGNVTADKLAGSAVTNAKIANDAVTTAKIGDDSISTALIQNNAVTTAKIANTNVTDAKIASNAVITSKISDANVTTVKIADSNVTLAKLASDLKQTTISNSDTQLPTSGAVVDYVAAQIAPIGGLEVIATEIAFPNTQPSAGVVISIADAGGIVVNGSGVSTTGRTVGGSTVTINGINSAFNNSTIDAGVSFMVSSTGSGQVYNFHKATLKEADILSLSNDLNDFANRYRVGSSNPTSSLDAGDLFFNTGTNKLLVYNGTNSAWEEAQSIGNYYINTISSYSGTGGNSASFNGSAYRFVLSNPGTTAEQHIVSVNGVVQKPNSGTSQPGEGFAIDGSSIIFSSAPTSNADFFIITIGSTVNIGAPSDNTVSTNKLTSGAVTTAKIADDAVTVAKIANIDGNINVNDNAKIRFGTHGDLDIYHDGSNSYLKDSGTGDLIVNANTIRFKNAANDEHLAIFDQNSYCSLYYDNVKKFETTSSGATITGSLTVDGNLISYSANNNSLGLSGHRWNDLFIANDIDISDNGKLLLGNSDDLQLYHDGSHNYITNAASKVLYFHGDDFSFKNAAANETLLSFSNGYGVNLYYDNSKKLETHSAGVKVSDGNLYLDRDDAKVVLGASDDLQIYHASNNNYVDIASGQQLYFRVGGSGNTKFYVQSGGAQFIGSLYGDDNNKIELGDSQDLKIYHDASNSQIHHTGAGDLQIRSNGSLEFNVNGTENAIWCDINGGVKLYYDHALMVATQSNGMKIHSGGASYLHFYDVNTSTISMYTNSSSLRWKDGVNNDNIMQLSQNGDLNIDGSYSNTGVDYAEYFESTDGTAIPVGTTVVLDNGKVRAATSSETPIGVIRPKTSGTCITGGVNELNWQGKYLVDNYDGQVMESAVHCTWVDDDKKDQQCWKDRPPTGVTIPSDAVETTRERPKLNPSFDESKTYVPRSERNEWNCVGLLGQIPITKGQPTSSNWIKMKDRSTTVELWMVK